MNDSDFAIDVRGVTKKFGDRTVVNDIAMQVRPGEIYGFLGPNGSGKTTFLRMLCGLLRPDGGSGNCLGLDFRRESAEIKKRVGYMTQRFSFYEDLTIEENLDFIAQLYGMPQRKAAVEKSLERLGMADRRRQLAGQLSGGWKQRLALAACLIHEPQLLLLDEPTAGVDPKARRDFWEEIHQLAADGLTVLDHDALHGRGGALPPARLHRLRQSARQRHGGRSRDKPPALTTWEVTGENLARAGRKNPQAARRGAGRRVWHDAARQRARRGKIARQRRAVDDRRAIAGTKIESGLEDVFISLMETAKDNFS